MSSTGISSRVAGARRRVFRHVSVPLPEFNFVTLHYTCYIAVWLFSSLLFWGAATPARSVSFTDAFYMGISAMSGAGMNVMNLSTLNTFQQIILWVDMIIGSPIVASEIIVLIRRRAFEKTFALEREYRNRQDPNNTTDPDTSSSHAEKIPEQAHLAISPVMSPDSKADNISFTKAASGYNSASARATLQEKSERPPLSSKHTKFSERLRLGGREYKAVVFLSWVIPAYVVAWQMLGALSMGACIRNYYSYAAEVNAQNAWWVGAFNAVSAFNNSGLSLLDANMVVFNQSAFIMLSMGSFILAGNTGYPIFLRGFVWILYKCLPDNEAWSDSKSTLKFLLDHPRRCYTNMFNNRHTWWLFGCLVTLNGIGTSMFAILNIGNKAVTSTFSPGLEIVAGMFQSFSSRMGGFCILGMTSFRVSLLVLYVIMMYTAAYPVAITIRSSNIYEERSLGIYSDDPEYETYKASKPESAITRFTKGVQSQNPTHYQRWFFFQEQIKLQLAHDLWLLASAVFLIMVIEVSQYERDPVTYSVFNVIFEVVSAYGTVGLTTGLPDHAYSFSGGWHACSKILLAFVMLQGRHRGLPVAIDKAVLLPGYSMQQLEEEDARIHAELHRSLDAPKV